ncbi:CHAT domain-containing protein [Lactifluus subvellereus]|nr:CHAT domain-containing protein [Lactifluus subvellereus]
MPNGTNAPQCSLPDVDHYIMIFQHHLWFRPRSHPDRPLWLFYLSIARSIRYTMSDEDEDLDEYILHLTEAILHPRARLYINVVQAFFLLTKGLIHRPNRFVQPGYVTHLVKYLRHLRNLPLEAFDVSRNQVTEMLIRALSEDIKLDVVNVTQHIEEMVVLCRELLTSHVSGDFPVEVFSILSESVFTEFSQRLLVRPIDQVIECLREAIKMCPPRSHQVHLELFLALHLHIRFRQTPSDDDYEEAITIFNEAIVSDHSEDDPSPCRALALKMITELTSFRCCLYQHPESTEEVISLYRSRLACPFPEDDCSNLLEHLNRWTVRRLDHFSLAGSSQEALSSASQAVNLRSTPDPDELFVVQEGCSVEELEAQIQNLQELFSRTPSGTSKYWSCVSALGECYYDKYTRSGDIKDIEQAIEYQRMALVSVPTLNASLEFSHLVVLGLQLVEAFRRHSRIEYLDESISLSLSLATRWKLLGRRQDLEESMHLYHQVSDDQYATAPERLDVACIWASCARYSGHPSVLTAYRNAMSLMQRSLVFAPTLEIQHARLVSEERVYEMPLDKLKDGLLYARKKHSPGSQEYEDILCSVLRDLSVLIGQPVIDRLRDLDIPEQSRIWWCPTSSLCSLPLHAMGPIPSDDGTERYFSDIYIPSYTPTLSALVESHGPGITTPDWPSLLLVGRPNDDLPEVWKEIGVIQEVLGGSAHCLVSEDATIQTVMEGLQHHRFAHFACHGNLVPGKPFDGWFRLEGEDRLTLLDIVRSHLPNAEFAFLSVCHTAELTDESVTDEALHLAAAMQYCGFRSVVGTMWAVVDEDGPEIARHFYKSMFSGEGQRPPSYKRSARALRNAVQKLRRKRGVTLERWVNFVHYGA